MVLVDTSVWIALHRGRSTEVGQRLWAMVVRNEAAVCGQVWVEFIGGFRRTTDRRRFERWLRAFPFLETTRPAFERAGRLLAGYPRLGAGDAIIAATAITNRAALLTLDGAFAALAGEGLELL